MTLGKRESGERGANLGLISWSVSAVFSGSNVLFPSVCAVACKDAAVSNAMSIFFICNHQFVAKLRKTVQILSIYSPTLTFGENKT
jgi:hypothetical protein